MATLSEALATAFAHHQAGRLDLAEEIYRRVLAADPEQAEAQHLLGLVAFQRGRHRDAIQGVQLAITLSPAEADYYLNLGTAHRALGNAIESSCAYERAVALRPDDVQMHSRYLCSLRYHPEIDLAGLSLAHEKFERRHALPLRAAWRPHDNSRHADRRLRLGFVSPGFCRGPVAHFLIRPLECLDRRECEVVCYSDGAVADEMTARFRKLSDLWRDTISLADAELAEQIRADAVDILFDLRGHSPRNRLLVLARKPAPVQITWLDSVGTSGLSAVDYVIGDDRLIPPDAESHYAERVLRMPDGYVCFEPPAVAPPVGPQPAARRGYVTFGSFNQPAKINPQVVRVWARVLLSTPGSRLILKYRTVQSDDTADHFRQSFAAEGVDPGRLEFQGHSPLAEYLNEYRGVDIALDPFPHSGGATTCDSLWMGVPVITCPGETFASRQSLSHLATVGLTDTIARDLDEYVKLAVALADDVPRLTAIRAGLRERIARSPLCDGPRFAENLMAMLRGVWRAWCAAPRV